MTGAIIVIGVSDKSFPRWVICATDREQERSLALKMKHCVSHLFGELVSTRHADLLGRGRTVQLEEVVEADVSPGGGDRVSDGEEDGGREEQRRLTDRLVETAWLESLILKVKLLQNITFSTDRISHNLFFT